MSRDFTLEKYSDLLLAAMREGAGGRGICTRGVGEGEALAELHDVG